MTVANTAAPHSRRRRWAMVLITTVILGVFGLLLLEMLLRVTGIRASALPYDNNLPDAALGMRPEGGKYWKANFPEYPGELYMRTNNRGFYEPADTSDRPMPGTIRIGVVGDSHTVGTCKPEENYPNRLEALLNDAAGREAFEVLNAGVGRYSPYQYYLRAQRDLLPLGTTHLVVAVYSGNDFLDLIREDDRPHLVRNAQSSFEAKPPTFMVYRDPNVPPGFLESSRVWQIAQRLLGPSILYQISRVRMLRQNLDSLGRGWGETATYLNEVRRLDRAAHGMMLQSLHQRFWFYRFPETLDTALAVNHEVLRKFVELERTSGVKVTVIALASKPQIEGAKLGQAFAAVTGENPHLTAEDVAKFDDMLSDRVLTDARQLGLDAVDVRPALRAAAQNTELFYPLDMHLNVAGNQVVAKVLAGHLAKQLIAPGGAR